MTETELVKATISDLRDGLEEMMQRREQLDWEISQKDQRIHLWEAKLAELTGEPVAEPKKRSPRGQNFKTILALLQDPSSPRQGLIASDIVERTKLSFSSVQAALKQGAEMAFFEQVDGYWRPTQSEAEDAHSTANAETNGKVN